MKKFTLFLCAAAICSTAMAQPHEKKDTLNKEYELNPVVVTGNGHHQRLQSTTVPVHVLTGAEINEMGLTRFEDILAHMVPQTSMAPNSMGSQLRLNGLSNKYILVLVNGKKLNGELSNNIDLNRISVTNIKRVEVLDGAASALYGSDAIAGVINIITDQPTDKMVSLTSDTRVSEYGKFTKAANLGIKVGKLGSYTSFTHDEAGSFRTNPLEYTSTDYDETQESCSPLYIGYKSNLFTQHFTYDATDKLSFNAGIESFWKMTDRPDENDLIDGGYTYEMRYKALRWNVGADYNLGKLGSLSIDWMVDKFRYGKEYDVETSSYAVGDYVQSKKQKAQELELKGIFNFVQGGSTVIGVDWKKEYMNATSGNVDEDIYHLAGYINHDQDIIKNVKATVGVRYTYHETYKGDFTPKVALMYTPGNFTIRAAYSNGFRMPGLEELYYHYFSTSRNKAQISFGNTDLKPEKSQYVSASVGYHNDIFAVNVMAYANYIKDMIVKENITVDDDIREILLAEFPEMTETQAAALSTYAQYVNAEKGEVKGIQANASANICKGFNLSMNYAYTYARSKSDGVWAIVDRSIKNTFTFAANYKHDWNNYTLNVNLNGRFQSKTYYAAYENAPGYGVWNINTTHTFHTASGLDIEPSLGIENILNHVDDRIDSSLRKYALYSPGRMVTVGLRFKL